MMSPFPGMDPYIEACGLWGDFQSHLIEKIVRNSPMWLRQDYLGRTQCVQGLLGASPFSR